jgi:hypothetical protein
MTPPTSPAKRDIVRALYVAYRSTYPAGIYPAFDDASAATLAPFDVQADAILRMVGPAFTLRAVPLALPTTAHHSEVLTILDMEAERGVDDAWLAKALGINSREALDERLAILIADGAVIIGREPPLNPREAWEDEGEPCTIQRCVGEPVLLTTRIADLLATAGPDGLTEDEIGTMVGDALLFYIPYSVLNLALDLLNEDGRTCHTRNDCIALSPAEWARRVALGLVAEGVTANLDRVCNIVAQTLTKTVKL